VKGEIQQNRTTDHSTKIPSPEDLFREAEACPATAGGKGWVCNEARRRKFNYKSGNGMIFENQRNTLLLYI
jgi:hypothetical protein